MTQVPDPADDLSGDNGEAFRRARAGLQSAWASASDSVLEAHYALAWGTMTGRELLDAYTHEFTVHAWDLSQATEGDHLLDPGLAAAALDWLSHNVAVEDHSESGPFVARVPVSDDADPYNDSPPTSVDRCRSSPSGSPCPGACAPGKSTVR